MHPPWGQQGQMSGEQPTPSAPRSARPGQPPPLGYILAAAKARKAATLPPVGMAGEAGGSSGSSSPVVDKKAEEYFTRQLEELTALTQEVTAIQQEVAAITGEEAAPDKEVVSLDKGVVILPLDEAKESIPQPGTPPITPSPPLVSSPRVGGHPGSPAASPRAKVSITQAHTSGEFGFGQRLSHKSRRRRTRDSLIPGFTRKSAKQEPLLSELRSMQEAVRAVQSPPAAQPDRHPFREVYQQSIVKRKSVMDRGGLSLAALGHSLGHTVGHLRVKSPNAAAARNRNGYGQSLSAPLSPRRIRSPSSERATSSRSPSRNSSFGSPTTTKRSGGSWRGERGIQDDKNLLDECLELETLERDLNDRREVRTNPAKRLLLQLEEAEHPERLLQTFRQGIPSPRHRAKRSPRTAQSVELPALPGAGSDKPWPSQQDAGDSPGRTRSSPPKTSRAKVDLFIIPSVRELEGISRQKKQESRGRHRSRGQKAHQAERHSRSSSFSSTSTSRSEPSACESGRNDQHRGTLAASCLKKAKHPWDPLLDESSKPAVAITLRKRFKSQALSAENHPTFSSWLSKQSSRRPSGRHLRFLHAEDSD